jgi:peptidoglycan hydrolase-like protein with peptidoglycan-binding domain
MRIDHARPTAQPAPLDAPSKSLRRGDRGVPVRKLQRALERTGHLSAADRAAERDRFGARTKTALEGFQRSRRLEADGIYGPKSRAALERAVEAPPSKTPGWMKDSFERAGRKRGLLVQGDRGRGVKHAERRLAKLGYKPGAQDARFDAKTRAAVKRFQLRANLDPSGWVDVATARKLDAKNAPKAVEGRPFQGYVNGRPTKIRVSPIGNGKVLRTDAAKAYKKMEAAARRAGVNLYPVSGARSMAEQRYLWNLYQSGRGNLAARPGYSNHQGGIAVDIGNVGGYGTRAYSWLRNNAGRFGFVNDVGGEYWHWTYRR